MMKTKQQGFTFVELVIVVVVLGLLAAVALPRFINLTDEAEVASAEGVAGGFASAVGMVRGQWEVDGRPAQVVIDGVTTQVNANGYPAGGDDTATIADDITAVQCLEAFNDSLSSAPRAAIAGATYLEGMRYGVYGSTGDNVCQFVQLYSLGLAEGTGVVIPATQPTTNTVGFTYDAETGQVTTFEN